MRLIPLASGSQGNATLVELGRTRVLVDAGMSEKKLVAGLNAAGVSARSIQAVVLSHEHDDHARGVERFSRLHRVPLVCAMETLEALDRSPIHFGGWQPLPAGATFSVGDVRIETFPVPHDAASPVGFVFEGEGLRVGIATDVGHASGMLVERLRDCDVLMIEANYDDRMLQDGPYPWQLKQRVAGKLGHLSNGEAGSLIERTAGDRCRAVVLAHLSDHNNTPALARRAARDALARTGSATADVRVALRAEPTAPVQL